jgi:hypothetical protein
MIHSLHRDYKLKVFERCTIVFQVVLLFFLKYESLVLQSNRNNNGNVNYKSEPLKLDVTATVPPPSTTTAPPPVTPATTSTPLSMRPRYPKEDPTLEYGAYDNPALTPSPVFENNQPETTPVSRRQESSFWTDCQEGNRGTWKQAFCGIKQPWAHGVSLYEEIPERLNIRGEGISERQKNLRRRDSWMRIVLRFRNCPSTTDPWPIIVLNSGTATAQWILDRPILSDHKCVTSDQRTAGNFWTVWK